MEKRERGRGGGRENKGTGICQRLCRALDLSADCLPGEGLVEIRGRGSVTLRGGGRILTYTAEEIRIALKRGSLRIEGQELVCTSYHAEAIGVEGLIRRVCFEED